MRIYFDHEKLTVSRGSGLECAACLDLLFIRHLLNEEELNEGKSLLKDIVSLLVGLIRSNSVERLHEGPVPYRADEYTAGMQD
jgi:hypothetical protein